MLNYLLAIFDTRPFVVIRIEKEWQGNSSVALQWLNEGSKREAIIGAKKLKARGNPELKYNSFKYKYEAVACENLYKYFSSEQDLAQALNIFLSDEAREIALRGFAQKQS